MKIRIKDIAEIAGVSAGTVDRVLHNRGEVSKPTRSRVLRIIERMNYEPDIFARTLASKRPLTVGLLIPFHTRENKFWLEPLTGIHEAGRETRHFGVELRDFLYNQLNIGDFEEKALSVLNSQPDAVIAAPVFQKQTLEFARQCRNRQIQIVLINDNINSPDQLSYIGQDARKSGGVAAHLMHYATGGSDVFLVLSIAREGENDLHIRRREEGFFSYWRTKTKDERVRIISQSIPDESYSSVRNKLRALFSEYPGIGGIYVTNSRVYQVARYLQEADLKRVVLIGYDLLEPNIWFLRSGIIDFLIDQKPREQGYRALMTILNALRMNKPVMPEQMLPIDIVTSENYCCYQV